MSFSFGQVDGFGQMRQIGVDPQHLVSAAQALPGRRDQQQNGALGGGLDDVKDIPGHRQSQFDSDFNLLRGANYGDSNTATGAAPMEVGILESDRVAG